MDSKEGKSGKNKQRQSNEPKGKAPTASVQPSENSGAVPSGTVGKGPRHPLEPRAFCPLFLLSFLLLYVVYVSVRLKRVNCLHPQLHSVVIDSR